MNDIRQHTMGSPDERACNADHPGGIPDHGWFEVLTRLGRSLARDDVWLRSAGVAFCLLFAAMPAAAVPVSVFGLLADPQAVHHAVEMLGGLLPDDVSAFLADQLHAIGLASRYQLGAGLGGAVLAALWGAWSGASGLIAALNTAYREEESRPFLQRSWHALLIAAGSGLFMVLTFALVAVLPLALGKLSPDPTWRSIMLLARWPALGLMCIVATAMLYRSAPCRRAAKWRWVSPGAIAATVMWLTCSTGFSFYVAQVPSYNRILGALGIFMLLLTWSYLTAFAILLGAELNAELERQTTRDTTRGPARQVGERGAAVADASVHRVAATAR